MEEKIKNGDANSEKHAKYAKFTADITFKKAFANEHCENRLIFLLNAFLKEKVKSPIVGVNIMNPELLGSTKYNRGSKLDIFCEDATGARFIVEIQVGKQEHFVRRTFFYLCMVIANLAKKGSGYDFNIPKLYSISFMEFDLDFGAGCDEAIQHLSIRNDTHPEIQYDMIQMTFVMLSRFEKSGIECETIIDKILFSLKNGHKQDEIPPNFTETELHELYEVAKISNFSEMELAEYERDMLARYDYEASIEYAKKEGIGIGITEGIAIGQENKEKEKKEALKEFKDKVFALLRQGYSLDEAERILEIKP